MRPIFHVFVSDTNQQNEEARFVQDSFCVAAGTERFSLDLT